MALGIGLAALAATSIILHAAGLLNTGKPRTSATRPTAVATTSERACPGSSDEVRYQMIGSAVSMRFTVQTPIGTEQGSTTGGSKTFCFKTGAFHHLVLENEGDSGSVECSIVVNGVVKSDDRSFGPHVIAHCDDNIRQRL